jgi:hypothetical protein
LPQPGEEESADSALMDPDDDAISLFRATPGWDDDGSTGSVPITKLSKKHEQQREDVDHPSHYNVGKIEVIDAIEDWFGKVPGPDVFNLGNAIKYIARAPYKGKREEDLKKAIWYLQRALGGNRKDA